MAPRLVVLALATAVAAGAAHFWTDSGSPPAVRPAEVARPAAPVIVEPKTADFGPEQPDLGVRKIADWAVDSADHQGLPFLIVDKLNAKVYAFNPAGQLVRSTPVLLGMGRGDVFPPGIAEMENMYHLKPDERLTPAGRFVAEEGLNLEGDRVLWIDYDAGIALHKIPAKYTKQRRHERIRSPDPAQHRITYGCINVAPGFYDDIVGQHFRTSGGIVYVLPEQKTLAAVFGHYDVNERVALARMQSSALQSDHAKRRF